MSNLNSGSVLNIEKKTLDAKILEILMDGNGFSADELGTYFYKDVIKGIIFSLKSFEFDAEHRKKEILDTSQFNFLVSIGMIAEDVTQDGLCSLIDKEMEEKKVLFGNDLQNSHSLFYYNVARNFANVDLDTFHRYIRLAASKTPLKSNYKIAAYHIGTYILNLPDETIELEEGKLVQGQTLGLKKGN